MRPITEAYLVVAGQRVHEDDRPDSAPGSAAGAVVTLSAVDSAVVTELPGKGAPEYLVLTNHDLWRPDPETDRRRTAVEQKLDEVLHTVTGGNSRKLNSLDHLKPSTAFNEVENTSFTWGYGA